MQELGPDWQKAHKIVGKAIDIGFLAASSIAHCSETCALLKDHYMYIDM